MDKMIRPVVKIVEGQLRGIIEKSIYGKSYAAFKGIPYAKPPIGELRFQVNACRELFLFSTIFGTRSRNLEFPKFIIFSTDFYSRCFEK